MANHFIIRNNDTWQEEIKPYLERLEKLTVLRSDYLALLKEVWPDKIWPNVDDNPDDNQLAAFRLSAFCTNVCIQTLSASKLTVSLWISGSFFAVPLNTRFIYESWGAVQYAVQLLDSPDREKTIRLTENLLVGVYKADVNLPTGGKATAKAPNVMEYIKALCKVDSAAEVRYGFLSSASHPNVVQNNYFSMMSHPYSFWGGTQFDAHAHRLLDEVLSAHESAFDNIQSNTIDVLKRAVCILDLKRAD